MLNHTSEIGGAEFSILTQVARDAKRDDMEFAVACPPGRLQDRFAQMGVPAYDLPTFDFSLALNPRELPTQLWTLARAAFSARRAAQRHRADVIHANSLRAGLIAGLARLMGGPPVITHVRDCLPSSTGGRVIRQIISISSNAVVANSRYTADDFAAGSNRTQPVVVYNLFADSFIANPHYLEEPLRAQFGIEPGAKLVGVVAQVTPWKGQATAIRAFDQIRQAHPDAHLLIIGKVKFDRRGARFDNRGYAHELRALVEELGLSDRVHFTGELDDVGAAFAELDVVMMPSWEEPFGRAAVEAMAMGCAVVATSVGGPPEFIEQGVTGVLCDPKAATPWAEAVSELLEDSIRATEMGARARSSVAHRFFGDSPETDMSVVYREVSGVRTVQADEPLRVLVVEHTATVGGAEQALLEVLVRETNRPEVELAYAGPVGDLSTQVAALGIPVFRLPAFEFSLNSDLTTVPRRLVRLLQCVIGVRRAARTFGADVIYANTIRAGLCSGTRLVGHGTPTVTHVHDCLPLNLRGRIIRRIVGATSDGLIANSAHTAQSFGIGSGRNDASVVYNLFDDRFLESAPDAAARFRQTLGIGSDAELIGVVAQITKWKGQDTAISAFAEVAQELPHAHLLIVGKVKFDKDGGRFDNVAYERRLKSMVLELGLQERVHFLGELPDVRGVLEALDLLLMPSWEEPFGRAAVEAMAVGTPVFATSLGGPSEFIEDGVTGVLIDPRDVGSWTSAMLELFAEPEMGSRLSREARESVRARFFGDSAETQILPALAVAANRDSAAITAVEQTQLSAF